MAENKYMHKDVCKFDKNYKKKNNGLNLTNK